MGKRYFWLKLKEDFFESKRIKKLRKIAGGDTYVIIYLKMQLLAMKNDGFINYTGLENTFAEELALDLGEDVDNVSMTLQYLHNVGLIETSNQIEYFLPYAVENVGSETASAQRVREYRNRNALHCNTDVTPMKQIGNGEKEIEKDIELDIEKDKDIKKKKVSPFDALPEDVKKAFIDFSNMRKTKLKKPMTDNAISRMIKRLYTLSEDTGVQIQILNQSEDNCWLDIYPLKEKEKKSTGKGGNVFLEMAEEEGII